MATKLNLDTLPSEIADRAKAVFGSVVNDLDKLLTAFAGRLKGGAQPPRRELLKLVAALRKSLDARLSALERTIAGPAKKKPAARKAAKKAVKKVAKKAPAKKAAKRR
jgi:hypothetical protein